MLHIAIAIGLILGLIVGLAASATGNELLLTLANGSAPFGTVFMNAIKMVVIPLAPALDAVGVPVAGLALMLGIDRIPDMMRSAINVLSQISTATLVERWSGGKQQELSPPEVKETH